MISLSHITFVVRDYDEAAAYFVDRIGMTVFEDRDLGGGKRWVVVGPPSGPRLLLAKAASAEQESRIGNQTGGRVAFFLSTDNFQEEYNAMTSRGVEFVEKPRRESYGTVAVFRDLYGNTWDLIQSQQ